MAVDNYRFWEGRAAAFEGEPIGPAMGVPLFVEGKVAGVIGLTPPGVLQALSPRTSWMRWAGWPSSRASC